MGFSLLTLPITLIRARNVPDICPGQKRVVHTTDQGRRHARHNQVLDERGIAHFRTHPVPPAA